MEPFGEHIADLRHGTACALLANVNRNAESRPEPYKPDEFIYWAPGDSAPDPEPEALLDPVAHSNLLRAALFGIAPKPTPDQTPP